LETAAQRATTFRKKSTKISPAHDFGCLAPRRRQFRKNLSPGALMFFHNLYGFGRRNQRGREIRRDDRQFSLHTRLSSRGGGSLPPYAVPAIAGVLLLLVVAGAAYGARAAGRKLCSGNANFLLREIVLPADLTLSREMILERIKIAPGDNLFSREPADIRADLMAVPAIRSAEVSRHLPDRLEIEIHVRQAVARVGNEGGFSYLVDAEGMVFTKSARHRTLPLIIGVNPVALKFGEAIFNDQSKDALSVLRLLEARKLQDVLPVRMISVGHPEYLDIRLSAGQQLKIPRNRLEEGLERIATAYQKNVEMNLGKTVYFMTDKGQVIAQ
jgi:cell division septal protein FtsQ